MDNVVKKNETFIATYQHFGGYRNIMMNKKDTATFIGKNVTDIIFEWVFVGKNLKLVN